MITVYRGMTPFSLVCRSFVGTCCRHLEGRRILPKASHPSDLYSCYLNQNLITDFELKLIKFILCIKCDENLSQGQKLYLKFHLKSFQHAVFKQDKTRQNSKLFDYIQCRFVKSNLNKFNSVISAMLVMTMAMLLGSISNFV